MQLKKIKLTSSCIYRGHIYHKRYKPIINKFKYNTFSFFIDYDCIYELDRSSNFFSYNRFNIFSFYDKDHGYRNGKNLKLFVNNVLKKHKVNISNLKIKILCFPRICGYVFNPISVIYCYKKNILISVFYEVKNTFNEQHTYYFINKKNIKNNNFQHKCLKKFYVSPFMDIKGHYEFKINIPKNNFSILINQFLEDKSKILNASQIGTREDFSDANLLKIFLRYPLLTLKIIFSIHWQAFKILIKGGNHYSRNKKKIDTRSYEGDLNAKL
tara:strand:+ start:26493 stop:27302 length:810 start_codon:yes stop_codon:yes gene_type:complete